MGKYHDGFRIDATKMRIVDQWEAAYGLELIRISREADEIERATGQYVEPYYPTEEEFREARLLAKRAKLGTRTPMLNTQGIFGVLKRG